MSTKDFWLWFLLAWLWGSSFLAIGIGVETLSPVFLVAGRLAVGAFCLLAALFVAGGDLQLGRRDWTLAAVVGLTGNVIPFLLISYAETQVDTGLAALIMGIAPVVTLCLAPLVHPDERLTNSKLLGGIVGFMGIMVLVGPSAISRAGAALVPQIALIGAALCYSLTALISRKYPYSNPLQTATASVLIGALGVALICLVTGSFPSIEELSSRSLAALVYLGVGPTALAALLYFLLVPRIGAGRLQQVNYVVPVIGMILGIVVLGERPEAHALLAIALVMLAVYLVSRTTKPIVAASKN